MAPLPDHLRNLLNEKTAVTIVEDNCRTHSRPSLSRRPSDYSVSSPLSSDHSDSSSQQRRCRWQSSPVPSAGGKSLGSATADRAPVMRRSSADAVVNTVLYDAVKPKKKTHHSSLTPTTTTTTEKLLSQSCKSATTQPDKLDQVLMLDGVLLS